MVLSLLGLTGLAFLYVMLVPPRTVPRRAHPRTATVPAPENAWTEYSQALADLGRETAPTWLREATTSSGLTGEQRAYLARHLQALAHLRAGSARARFEFFEEVPTMATPVPDLQRLVAASHQDRLSSGRSMSSSSASSTVFVPHRGRSIDDPDEVDPSCSSSSHRGR